VPHPALTHATVCLRRAETLAGLAGAVSGPADAAPVELSAAWINDWVERAKRGLETAWDDAKKEAESAKDRAKKIAENIESGAKAVKAMPGQVVDTAREALEKIVHVAQVIQWTIIGGGILLTVILGGIYARYMGWI
jgi:hypothetical protein